MNFKFWLETVSVTPSVGNYSGIGTGNNDDDGDDNDDESWSFDNIRKKYEQQIQKWSDESPCAKKIKGKLLEILFKNPSYEDMDLFTSHETSGEPDPEGELDQALSFHDGRDFKQSVADIVKNPTKCDLWKYLKVQPNEIWNIMDKGDMEILVYHILYMAISGVNVHLLNQPRSGYGSAGQYLGQNAAWGQDKLTIDKYGRFVAKQYENDVKKHVQEELAGYARGVNPEDIDLNIAGIRIRKGPGDMKAQIVYHIEYKL
jgi:hypothetical protein